MIIKHYKKMKRHAQLKKGIKNELTGGASLHYTAMGKWERVQADLLLWQALQEHAGSKV